MVVIAAKFDGKNFVPDKVPEGLAPNTQATVIVPTDARPTGLDAIVGILKDTGLPKDYAAQIDHYLYGTPKR